MRTRPLSAFSASELRVLLDAEAVHWRDELLWDYSEVSAAVAAGVARRSLAGRVIEAEDGPAAYCYFIQEAGRAVVGSLFAAPAARGRGFEEALLDAVLDEAKGDRENTRVECQTLFSTAPAIDACFTRAGFRSLERHYLVRDLCEPLPPPPPALHLRNLRKDDLGSAADIIYRSHRGSLDAAVNLTYGTLLHCRGFVDTLALRGGCGSFDSEASLVADTGTGALGVLLASRLSSRTGHVCQVSVLPGAQRRGLGTALVVAALHAFRRQGHESASLSVTVDNAPAYRLYEGLGFRLRKRFAAHAWVRPPLRLELPA
jgi:ribosomal protein S18 acetylase RimI-like enzyme